MESRVLFDFLVISHQLVLEAIYLGRIFGTDGVRGIAISELTIDLAMKIGKYVSKILAPNGGKILIGKDTRISSSCLECALAAGISSYGTDVVLLGVVPTPAVAYLTKMSKSCAGIMVSASHNSFEFNGIKIFNSDGFKISNEIQNEIENLILDDNHGISYCPQNYKTGTIKHDSYLVSQYYNYLKKILRSVNLKVVFDCANGAASNCAGKIFKPMEDCEYLNISPDGFNINKNCGSTCLSTLSNYVTVNKFDLGIAFDGDADRCLAIDCNGEIIDGDHIIAAVSLDMKNKNSNFNNIVVGTMMSNMGLENFLKDHGITFLRTKIGDRFVAEEMRNSGSLIGGEQSGHIIFSQYSTTGDAILTAITLINLVSTLKSSSEIPKLFSKCPQFVKNIKIPFEDFCEKDEFKLFIKKLEGIFENDGRVFVRKSGTEPVVRVMCESMDARKLSLAREEIEKFESLNCEVKAKCKI